jgi:hypothetical protein
MNLAGMQLSSDRLLPKVREIIWSGRLSRLSPYLAQVI